MTLCLISFMMIVALIKVDAQTFSGGRLDSLSAAGAVDTVKFYPFGSLYSLGTMGNTFVLSGSGSQKQFGQPMVLDIEMTFDSLTGATGGSGYVQVYDGDGTPTEKDWVTLGTGTMANWRGANGTLATATGGYVAIDKPLSTAYSATRQYAHYYNANFNHKHWRFIALCPSSTQLTAIGLKWRITPACS